MEMYFKGLFDRCLEVYQTAAKELANEIRRLPNRTLVLSCTKNNDLEPILGYVYNYNLLTNVEMQVSVIKVDDDGELLVNFEIYSSSCMICFDTIDDVSSIKDEDWTWLSFGCECDYVATMSNILEGIDKYLERAKKGGKQ